MQAQGIVKSLDFSVFITHKYLCALLHRENQFVFADRFSFPFFFFLQSSECEGQGRKGSSGTLCRSSKFYRGIYMPSLVNILLSYW